MKCLKVLSLVAVATMALLAVLGASSASATVLCKTPLTSGCAGGPWDYEPGAQVHATLEQGTSITVGSTSGSIENTCTASTVKGGTSTTGSSSETVRGAVSALTFSGCSNTTDVLEVGQFEVHWVSGTDNGTLTAIGFDITVNLAGVSCAYGAGAGTDLGTVTGGSMATIDLHAILNKVTGGFLCPNDTVWDAKYTVTEPEPLYISTN